MKVLDSFLMVFNAQDFTYSEFSLENDVFKPIFSGQNVGKFRIIVAAVAGCVCCLCRVWVDDASSNLWVSSVNVNSAQSLRPLPDFVCVVVFGPAGRWYSRVNSVPQKTAKSLRSLPVCFVCVLFGPSY